MRVEDKQLDGPDLARAQKQIEDQEREEAEVDELAAEVQRDVDRERRELIVATMRHIVERRHVVVDTLPLAQRDLNALAYLQAAVEGKDPMLAQFVYAEDRKTLLEQALAILQPSLVHEDAKLRDDYQVVVASVARLRVRAERARAEAQEELCVTGPVGLKVVKPEGDDDEGEDDKPKPSTLDGPAVEIPPWKSTLGDEDA